MTEAQRQKFHRLCDELNAVDAASNLSSYDNMCSWLRSDHYGFYLEVKDYLYELWQEIKSALSSIAEGALKTTAAVVGAPIVGLVEGVKEGLNNGVEAGVKKGVKAIGSFLDDLFS